MRRIAVALVLIAASAAAQTPQTSPAAQDVPSTGCRAQGATHDDGRRAERRARTSSRRRSSAMTFLATSRQRSSSARWTCSSPSAAPATPSARR